GGGALLGFAFSRRLGLELGGIYIQRKFNEIISGSTTKFQATAIHVPVFFKFWLARWLSLGVGGYASQAIGKFKATDSSSTTSYSYSSTPLKTLDYGLLVGGGFNFQIKPGFGIFLDARYAYGIASAAKVGAFYHNDALAMLGLRFGRHPLLSK
ncbi:MAG: outer membrane beta-barrel protein, partial [Bdellovibrionota bacterium]